MSLSNVPIPERMRSLPKDERRGVPIPWVTFVDAAGVPDFRILDEEKKLACYRRRLCGLCCRPLDYWIVFVGGPLSVQNQIFADPAMHPECAEYALAVCPSLVYSRARYSQRPLPDMAHADELQSSERTEVMYRYVTWQYEIVDVNAHAARPKDVREFRGHEASETKDRRRELALSFQFSAIHYVSMVEIPYPPRMTGQMGTEARLVA